MAEVDERDVGRVVIPQALAGTVSNVLGTLAHYGYLGAVLPGVTNVPVRRIVGCDIPD